MKKLAETMSLRGQKETITISELRKSPGEVFQQVQMGKEFDVTKSGKVIATIAPPELNAVELGKLARQL